MSKPTHNKYMILFICIFLGCFGVHRFIVGKYKSGLLYLCTVGLFGFGWLVDIVLICLNKFPGLDNSSTSSPNYTAPVFQETKSFNAFNSEHVQTETSSINELPNSIDSIPRAYYYENVDVCIIKEEKPDFSRLKEFEDVVLSLEPTNPYDPKAIKISTADSMKVGYLYRGKLKDMAYDFLTLHNPVRAKISNISDEKITINLAFYRKGSTWVSPDVSFSKEISFKLSSSTKDMQETIENCVSEGDELEFEFDFEKEKYLFFKDNEACPVGFAPKKYAELLERIDDNSEDYHAEIETIDESDNGKYFVVITFEYNE